ncbi:MAG: L-histidine N(alpha)-methyltransferase [Micromonosporaceae bacterium]
MTPLEIVRYLPSGFLAESLRADALAGLTASPKELPPKWFYDERGSELFDEITRLPEYYPTRAEREILRDRAGEIATISGAHTLVELGSGSAEKTGLLLDALRAHGTLHRYVPVDVSETALRAAAQRVQAAHPGLAVQAVVSDFEEHLGLPTTAQPGGHPRTPGGPNSASPRMVAFLGSTIGNLVPAQRAGFLASVRAELDAGDSLLLGTDLVKDPATLVAAYDDAAGVTAAFNKNVLSVINSELGGDFDLDTFAHVAVWDAAAEWIEMRLRSLTDQTVKISALDLAVPFGEGEEMRTEVSAKFRADGVRAELAAAGFGMRAWWTDARGRFGLSLSVPVEPM